MAKLYVITDTVMDVDSFVFLQNNDGSAASYFYNWCLMQNHRDFFLSSIGEIGYMEESSNHYEITKAERLFVCDMPTEEQENEQRRNQQRR